MKKGHPGARLPKTGPVGQLPENLEKQSVTGIEFVVELQIIVTYCLSRKQVFILGAGADVVCIEASQEVFTFLSFAKSQGVVNLML